MSLSEKMPNVTLESDLTVGVEIPPAPWASPSSLGYTRGCLSRGGKVDRCLKKQAGKPLKELTETKNNARTCVTRAHRPPPLFQHLRATAPENSPAPNSQSQLADHKTTKVR